MPDSTTAAFYTFCTVLGHPCHLAGVYQVNPTAGALMLIYSVLLALVSTTWILVITRLTRTPELRQQYGQLLGWIGTGLGLTAGLLGLTAGYWFGLA